MVRNESLNRHIATAGVTIGIEAIGLAALVKYDNPNTAHHHAQPGIGQQIGKIGLQGGVEAPPALDTPNLRHLTPREIQITGGTPAP